MAWNTIAKKHQENNSFLFIGEFKNIVLKKIKLTIMRRNRGLC
jgi:hypothetical protein